MAVVNSLLDYVNDLASHSIGNPDIEPKHILVGPVEDNGQIVEVIDHGSCVKEGEDVQSGLSVVNALEISTNQQTDNILIASTCCTRKQGHYGVLPQIF